MRMWFRDISYRDDMVDDSLVRLVDLSKKVNNKQRPKGEQSA